MNLSGWIQRHRRSLLFLMALLVLGGVYSGTRLPVALFPHVAFPRVEIYANAGDRPAKRMLIQVTYPVEEAVRGIPGVVGVRSTTSRGSADFFINFHWGENMTTATLEVQAALAEINRRLPTDTTFQVRRMRPTIFRMLAYTFTSRRVSQVTLRDIARYQLRPLLSAIPGVARVGVLGGRTEEYRVTVNPARLAEYGLTIGDVARALAHSNVLRTVGHLQENYRFYLVISNTRLHRLRDIRRTVLRSGGNGIVRLDEVATVARALKPQWTQVVADGQPAVSVQIYQQPGGNTVAITRTVKKVLRRFERGLPRGVHVRKWYDQGVLIQAAAHSVRDAVLIGALLAALVLLLFLRNVRITFIALITVPSVLAATMLLLFALHMSFNIMTLGGMAASVGLIIDDTIVMLEHIMRRLHERGATAARPERVMTAVRQFTRPLVGSSASTIIIFTPLAFLSGVTGAFFRALSLTMAASLIISFFVAWLAVPILADHFLKASDLEAGEEGPWTRRAHALYERLMRAMFRDPRRLLLAIVALVGLGVTGFALTGSGFMPSMDEGGFVLNYRAAPGTSLTETARLLDKVQKILLADHNIRTYSLRTGLQLGGGITGTNEGDFFVLLKPYPRPSVWRIMAHVRRAIHERVPGLRISMDQPMQDLIGDLTGAPQPVEIKVFSGNGPLLRRLGPEIAARLRRIRGIVNVRDGIVYAGDAVEIRVNRAKAALEGVNPQSVTRQLAAYLNGTVATDVQRGVRMIGVRVWVPRPMRRSLHAIRDLRLRAANGRLFPLRAVAVVRRLNGQPEIARDNLKRMIPITARIAGRSLGGVMHDVKRLMARRNFLPPGVYATLGGVYVQQQIAFAGLMAVFVAAVALVFLLLLFLYERFLVTFALMATTLLALSAVFVGLWVTGTELNISSMMGMTMVVGIVTEVAIFYYSEYQDVGEGDVVERLIAAGKNRLRPIAMTTLAAILALLPLASGWGQGSAMQQPLAIAIISGLLVQLPLALVALPLFLSWGIRYRSSES
ncbi:MAG: efflux RND transporter permease subunit [Gammaproteobacteria bacterium]|jgi:CzcA family heavy metal efflux pump|nr:efflux RND transporter permease subunit [Gammaproteobacteria bacterium]MDA8191892.1 efflux RND transporter permease subunit [Gammaproteobacteria bacterium]